MKKLVLLFVSLAMIGLTSCSKDEEEKVSTIVNVKVTNKGKAEAGVTVCLFSEQAGFNSPFFTPFHADRKIITESDGVARFELQNVFDLDAVRKQTTFYFGVFKGSDTDPTVLGKTAVTIKKGETKTVEITL